MEGQIYIFLDSESSEIQVTFLRTFMANIFPVFAPVTFRTWNT